MSVQRDLPPKFKADLMRSLDGERLSFWELLSRWDGRLEDFVRTVNAMYEAGELRVEDDGRLALAPALAERAPRTLGVRPCPSCKGRGIDLGRAKELWVQLEELLQERPLTTPKYFQGNIDVESAVAKVCQMDALDGLAGKTITVVGDDDYLSLALALTGLPERIIKGLLGQSDLFASEPLETVSGFLTFFSRGAATLKPGGVGYVGLTTLESPTSSGSRPWRRSGLGRSPTSGSRSTSSTKGTTSPTRAG